MNILSTTILCGLFSYGMFTVQRPSFLLDSWRNLWKKLPKSLHEPLFECGICTASVWGTFSFLWLYILVPIHWLFALPIVLVAASGIGAFLDRGVKAFEKHYGYKPPGAKKDPDDWSYLFSYLELRSTIVENFVQSAFESKRMVYEIGGRTPRWFESGYYDYFDRHKAFTPFATTLQYDVVILGLAFDGDLSQLAALIRGANRTIIEYSDDGISRDQAHYLTRNLKTKVVIPEYFTDMEGNIPAQCGVVTKRKIIIAEP